jgi:hypothetical protein
MSWLYAKLPELGVLPLFSTAGSRRELNLLDYRTNVTRMAWGETKS